ncbi:50S ribosomal protein L28 [Candidatus Gracilibacteria bacterium]|nr:50S ribosomal protein L28 [Thermales bacterium]NJL96602.1 50S ribosomal protein L28 [Candidatus Gracilibacteria bacterium]NJS40833.1 50S ribosomal protein L28 [Candidatus Gracilibacteria bacterium]
MPAKCAITGTTYKKVKKRSKSMQSTITRVRSNLQKIKIGNKQVKVSVRALRTLKKKLKTQVKVVV